MKIKTIIMLELLLVVIAMTAGGFAGHSLGRKQESDAWMRTMIDWGCAGYDKKTGIIVIEGSCSPLLFEAVDPQEPVYLSAKERR